MADKKQSGLLNLNEALDKAIAQKTGEEPEEVKTELAPKNEEGSVETAVVSGGPDASPPPAVEAKPDEVKMEGDVLPSLDDAVKELAEKPAEPEKPAEKPAAPDPDLDDAESPHDPPRFKERLKKAKKRGEEEAEKLRSKYESELAALKAKLTEVESKPVPTVDPETIKLAEAEKEELLMLRRLQSAEKDPEIKKDFDDRIADNVATIEEILSKTFTAPEDQEKLKKLGRFDQFAAQNPQAAKSIIDALTEVNPLEADTVRLKIAENASLGKGRARVVAEAAKNAKEWFQKREDEAKHSQESLRAQIEAENRRVVERLQKAEQHDLFKDRPLDGLEGERKAAAESENKTRAKMRYVLKVASNLQPTDTKTYSDMAIAAALSHGFRDKLVRAETRIKELEDQIKQRAESGSVARTARATARVAPTREETKPSGGNFLDNIDKIAAEMEQRSR